MITSDEAVSIESLKLIEKLQEKKFDDTVINGELLDEMQKITEREYKNE
jgi:uncharacterized protein YbcV (DUF1398 family)